MRRVIATANWLAVLDIYGGLIAVLVGAHDLLPVIGFGFVICLSVSAVLGAQVQQGD